MQRFALFLGATLLAGCAATPAPQAAPPPPPPGMELLLQKPAETAIALLGKPRLDKREGPARQLQFAGGCVLDLWYYPKPGPELVAIHADARLPDGRDFAPGDCLQLLLRSRPDAAPPAPQAPPAKPERPRRQN
jgi:hypothetical protein